MTAPTVSICIANYNGIDLIDACIASVQSQDCPFAFEIIVHDDASTDGSAAHIRTKYPSVRLIESAENVGFCIANNRMAAAASGEFLLLLNNDAELFPDALRLLHREARGLQGPAILSLPQFDFDTGTLIDRGCLLDPFFNPVPNLDAAREDVAMVIGACLWIPKSLWDELGGFPEWFGSIGEDLYLCCRARLAGHPVRVLPASGYRHRVGQSFGGGKVTTGGRLVTTLKRRALTERNKTYTLVVTYPLALLVFILPLHLLLLHVEGLVLSVLKRDGRIFSVIYAPLLPSIWRASAQLLDLRRRAQAQGRISLSEFVAPIRWMPRKLVMLLRHGLPEVRQAK